MGALPRDSGKICIGDGDQQIAPEKEGVSIFFGRSSIETVKSFAVNRCNSIPKEFEEDLARAPSTGSVARKAAFFDHYIRSVSLEKKVASVSVSVSVEEEEEDCQGEDEEEEEQEQGFVFLEQPRDDPVEDQLDQVEAEEEEDEEQRDLAECPTDPAAEEMANDEEQEQDLFASTVAAAADVQEEHGTMNPFKDGEVDEDEAEEESTTRPAIKSEELNATIEKPEKNSCSASASAPAPAPASASASASRRRNSRTTTRSSEQVINKWKSKHGLIPGFRAAQVTSKTATEQSAGRKAVVAASSSSKGGRTKNNSETAAAAAGAAAAAAAAVAKSPVDDEPNAIRRPSSNPRDRDRSGRSIGSGAANGFTFRSNERAEKRKEFNRRMEAKQSAKEAEKNKMQAKTQEEMQAEIKELRRGLNFKATPMPGFYQEQPSTKSAPDVRKQQPVHHHARNAKPVPPSDVHRPSRQQRNDIGKLKKAAGGRTTTSSAIAVS